MIRFLTIQPAKKFSVWVQAPSLTSAMALIDLDKVDHGVVSPGLGIVVYEYGLFVPPAEQHYFSIRAKLYAGNAVLYAFDKMGETVSLARHAVPEIVFMPSAASVERSIQLGLVERPQMAINGEVTWQWPEPRGKVSVK